jgi:hypothetical protein
MTVVGKILAWLNLAFSITVGVFLVMDYTSRTHWVDAYEKLKQKYQVVQASSVAFKAEADQLAKDKQDLNNTLRTVAGDLAEIKNAEDAARKAAAMLRDRGNLINELKGQLATAKDQLNAERTKVKQYETTSTVFQQDNQRRLVDSDKLRQILKAETDKNIQLTRDMNEMRDRAVAAEIQARAFKDMNGRLEAQLQDMARDMTRMRANAGSAAGGANRGLNPPPDNVEGLVRRAEGNLVTITIGSDAGLQRGHTMEVFRYGQNPRYIGRIRIVEVTPTQAVGQATGRLTAPMQVGDRVASRILGGN